MDIRLVENRRRNLIPVIGLLGLSVLLAPTGSKGYAWAQADEEMRVLEMFYEDKELVVTPTRDPKPVSQVAENITVITAKEIRNLNAHTLADVLVTITGVQQDWRGGPGSLAFPGIQGSNPNQVLVLIDGVSQTSTSSNFADVGAIPVQNIERVEIIKGPASTSWGSSLGGIINVITKSPEENRAAAGMVSASLGERFTGDYRGELTGTVGQFGYYLSGGKLHSDGLLPHNSVDTDRAYLKLTHQLPDGGDLRFSLGYSAGDRGDQMDPVARTSYDNTFDNLLTTLSISLPLTERIDWDLSLRSQWLEYDQLRHALDTGLVDASLLDDRSFGATTKLVWRTGNHSLTVGAEFDRGDFRLEQDVAGVGRSSVRSHIAKAAIFTNDTIVLGPLTITPGIRFDHTTTNGDFLSPSLGVTWGIGEHTVLRGAVARGFTVPPVTHTMGDGFALVPNPDLKMEKVLSWQAGFETSLLRYLWLKSTFFLHDVSGALVATPTDDGRVRYENQEKQRRQGVEVEVKTIPFLFTTMGVGYTFVDSTDRETHQRIPFAARQTVSAILLFDDLKDTRANLAGRYIWWNADSSNQGRYGAMVWDLNAARRIYRDDRLQVELFLSVRNLFNGSQYVDTTLRNPRRWFEGGVRFDF
ncbi:MULTISPECIES: TonB-dependent receptor plug domain-containing protein [Geobacter]|uniref:TonB-dependent receptor plug domain-containing protein n=2 Tax=Geobacteraceae TaxID=213422 RepID=UPI0025739EF5|nr:TonB-dependent receptor [Geobacter sulfurreducens]BEH10570.1 TonB-dependent receptor [Geobacter sulfurreducens subsp. ethanolicus]BET57820.1 TonB-dependent receptor [Geobacter sp. 60473]